MQTQPVPRVRPFLPGKWREYRRGDGEYMKLETATARAPKRAVTPRIETTLTFSIPLSHNGIGDSGPPLIALSGTPNRALEGLFFLSRGTRTFRAMAPEEGIGPGARRYPGYWL